LYHGPDESGWSKLQGESAYEALMLTRSALEVLMDYSPKIGVFSLESQLSLFLRTRDWPCDVFVKCAKFHTAFPMATYLGQDLPPVPEGYGPNLWLWSGPIRRFLKSRLVSKNRRTCSLFWGYLQGVKRGAAVVGEESILEAFKKHRETLSQPSLITFEEAEEFMDRNDELLLRLVPVKGTVRPEYNLREPSRSAAVGAKRSEGGGREMIREFYSTGLSPDLFDIVETSSGLVERFGPTFPRYQTVLRDFLAEGRIDLNRPSPAVVSAVLEPLKVRLITKTNAFANVLVQPLQKAMWKHLVREPQFALIGEPLRTDHLYGILEREASMGWSEPDMMWVSGDYSAATDGLDIDLTKQIFERFVTVWKTDFLVQTIARRVLYEQELQYPEWTGLDPVLQQNGQLMGSILSFPVLCIANLLCYWQAMELYHRRKIALRNLPVLINGDDILFRATPKFYELWKKTVALAGFKLSIGKNYIHPTFFTINSECFQFGGDRRIRPVGYLNAGLLTGQTKLTGREQASQAPIWDYYNLLMAGSNDPARAHRRFLHYHIEEIKKLTWKGLLPLHLPPRLGGFGFQCPDGLVYTTTVQRRLATFLFERFLADLRSGKATGLIQVNRPIQLLKKDTRNLVYDASPIGPYAYGLQEPSDLVIRSPPLMDVTQTDQPEFIIRYPPMKVFRETKTRRAGDEELREWVEGRVLQRVALPSCDIEPDELIIWDPSQDL
jgi:hypothetical protein